MAILKDLYERVKRTGMDTLDIIDNCFEGDNALNEIFDHERNCKGFRVTYHYLSRYRRGGTKTACYNCEWIITVKIKIKNIINARENCLVIGYMRQNTVNYPMAIISIIFNYYIKKIVDIK